MILHLTDDIDVDTVHPWSNREVMVSLFADLKYDDSLCNGYEIKLLGDPRDAYAGRFKASYFNEQSILIEMPAVSADFLYDADNYADGAHNAEVYCERSQDNDNVLRNNLQDNADLNRKFLLLQFPQGVYLSSDKFCVRTSGLPVLDNTGYLVEEKFVIESRTYYTTKMVNRWRIGILEESQRNIIKRKTPGGVSFKVFSAKPQGTTTNMESTVTTSS
jgi:hypothetical protein